MHNANILPIEGQNGLHRDINTHAVINTNNSEYEAFLRQRQIIKDARESAALNRKTVDSLCREVEILKEMVTQLINREKDASAS